MYWNDADHMTTIAPCLFSGKVFLYLGKSENSGILETIEACIGF